METNMHFTSYIAQFLLEWEMFMANIMQKIKTHFMLNNFFFRSCRL